MKDLLYLIGVLQANKKVSKRLYDKLIRSDEIPNKIKHLVKKVWKKQQSGGNNVTRSYKFISFNLNNNVIITYDSSKQIGNGAYGSVHEFGIYENKIYQKVDDKVIKVFNNKIDKDNLGHILSNIELLYEYSLKKGIENVMTFTKFKDKLTFDMKKSGYFLNRYNGELTKILNENPTNIQDIINNCINKISTLNNLGIINGDIKRGNILYKTQEETKNIDIYIHDFDDAYIGNVEELLKPIKGYISRFKMMVYSG